MYKLTLGSINELKYSNTDTHGLFSGTIETDRVVKMVWSVLTLHLATLPKPHI